MVKRTYILVFLLCLPALFGFSTAQNSFNGGEISPQVYGRVDIDRYTTSYKESRNFIPQVYGALTRRPGFKFIAEVGDSTKATRIVSFEYSNTQAYILEFGETYIRCYKDGAQIIGGDLITNGSMETNGNWTTVGAGADSQSSAQSYDGLYSWTFTPSAQYEGIQSDTYTSVTGVTYTVTAWIRPPAATTVARVVVRKGDNSGDLHTENVTGLTASAWNEITFDVAETAGGAGAYVQVLSGTGIAAGAHYVDVVFSVKDSVYEITTTYTEDELFDLNFAQSADTLFIAHGEHPPATLVRNGHDDWVFSDISFIDGPYLDQNDTAVTLDSNGDSGSVIITASAPLFYSTDVGRLVSQLHDVWGVAEITAFTSSTVVTATTLRDFDEAANPGNPAANTNWKLGVWSDTTSYPKCVILDKERLCWANSEDYPENIWMSEVGVYTSHGAGVNSTGAATDIVDSDAINVTLGSKKVAAIQWLESMKNFTLGTLTSEYWLTSSSGSGAITGTSKQAVSGSYHGSSAVSPVTVGNVIIHADRSNKSLREVIYSFESDSFSGEELTLLAEHVTKDYTIEEMAYQDSPFRCIWLIRSDGALVGITYDRAQKVVAFHIHTTQQGEFESVASISGGAAANDELWVVVKRSLGSGYVRYIEKLASYFRDDNDSAEAFLVDSGLTYDARQAITSITHADPGVINLSGHGYSDGDRVMFRTIDDDIVAEIEYDSLNYSEYVVANAAAGTFELEDDAGDSVALDEVKQVISATVGKMVSSVSGLGHLEGEEVVAIVDGMVEPAMTVSSGTVTLSDNGGSVIHVGLPYTSYLKTLSPDVVASTGETSQIDKKQIKSVRMKLYNSMGFFVGRNEDNIIEYTAISDAVPMSRAASMHTGDTRLIQFNGENDSDVGIYIEQEDPVPLTILSIMYEITIAGDF